MAVRCRGHPLHPLAVRHAGQSPCSPHTCRWKCSGEEGEEAKSWHREWPRLTGRGFGSESVRMETVLEEVLTQRCDQPWHGYFPVVSRRLKRLPALTVHLPPSASSRRARCSAGTGCAQVFQALGPPLRPFVATSKCSLVQLSGLSILRPTSTGCKEKAHLVLGTRSVLGAMPSPSPTALLLLFSLRMGATLSHVGLREAGIER